MDVLPSYSEATSRKDWLSLVAPFIPASQWTCCCLVDRRFYSHFAPRLWRDPLVTIRQLGLHPNDDLACYRRFIYKHSSSARLQTRRMVKSLDFRTFALRASGLYSTEASERAISESFRGLPELFPELLCLLIDGHPELDPSSLVALKPASPHSLELLDLARCRQELTPKLFSSELFRELVYLDISYIPGSIGSAIRSTLNPTYLPALRVLKVQGRELDDATAQLLFQAFRLQLWSVDLSHNKLGDSTIDAMLAHSFSSLSFRTDAQFEVEGKVMLPRDIGTYQHGPFEFIQESTYSATYTHPVRYLADPPIYTRRAEYTELQEWQTVRSNGVNPRRHDDASKAKKMLLETAMSLSDQTPRQPVRDLHLPRGGVTHIYLNGNRFTTNGIAKLLRVSSGRLEHFECDNCIHTHYASPVNQDRGRLHVEGLFGLSHLFRPVFASNLRSIRVHHSLVTQVPSIAADGLRLTTALRLSETVFARNVSRVYPQRFVPDMNPRIASITLTNIPARSIGRIIEQLTSFLELAILQERNIAKARLGMGDRYTAMLSGLRYIRFEIDPDFSDDSLDSSTGQDIDFDKLLDPGDENFSNDTFSFFSDTKEETQQHRQISNRESVKSELGRPSAQHFSNWTSGRLKSPPYSDTNSQYVNHYHQNASTSWTGNVYSIPVWIGSGTIGPHAAVNEYMWNLQDADLRAKVGPATPDHVAAGVPASSYIFYAAWDAMIAPRNLAAAVKSCGTEPFRDVAAAIKEYRACTRGTPRHWNGKIELVRINGSSRYHASEYWR